MWIVAIGWAYVVILMAATETSVIAGIMTFFLYCVLPLSILFYLTGAGRRRARRARASTSSNATSDAGDITPMLAAGSYMPIADGSADSVPDCSYDGGGFDGGGGGGDGGCGGGGD